jgi:hypothetical protein
MPNIVQNKKDLKTETGSKFRLFLQYEEIINHIITVPNTGKRQNIKQYGKVSIQLHSALRKQTGVKYDKQHGYEKFTSEYASHKSYVAVKPDKTVPHNNPEKLVLDSGKEHVNRYCFFRRQRRD